MSTIKSLLPKQAWSILDTDPNAVLLDVRDRTEFNFVGHPIGAINIPWKDAPTWQPNPNFLSDVRQRIAPNAPVLIICRSGQRSLDACKVLIEAGYTDVSNVEEGFEGPLDEHKHRNTVGGWRAHGLPWQQS
jgi:rhodanese-related sulfurtransferase